MTSIIRHSLLYRVIRTPLALAWNIVLVYVVYGLCRILFWAENQSSFPDFWQSNSLSDIMAGAWKFDTSAILYTNALYAVLMLLPLHWKEQRWWQRITKPSSNNICPA